MLPPDPGSMNYYLLFVLLLFIPSAFAESPSAGRIKIGVSLPLTGSNAEYGASVRNGIQLAQKRFPERFKKISLGFEDNQYESKAAISAFQKLKLDGSDLIYSWGEVPLSATAPLAARYQLPLIAVSLDRAPALRNPFVIRSVNDSKEFVAPVVQHFRKKGVKNFGIVYAEDPFLSACSDSFKNALLPDESLQVIGPLLPGENDLKPSVLKLKEKKLEALGLYLFPGQVSSYFRTLHSNQVSLPTFGTDIFESRAEIIASGPAIEGSVYPNFGIPSWFSTEYEANFGNDAQIAYGFNGYAWAAITAEIFESVQATPSNSAIIKLYSSVKGNEGGVKFRYRETPDGDRYYEFPVVLKQIKDGAFKVIE